MAASSWHPAPGEALKNAGAAALALPVRGGGAAGGNVASDCPAWNLAEIKLLALRDLQESLNSGICRNLTMVPVGSGFSSSQRTGGSEDIGGKATWWHQAVAEESHGSLAIDQCQTIIGEKGVVIIVNIITFLLSEICPVSLLQPTQSHRVILLQRGAVGILSSFIMLVQKQNGGRDAELKQARMMKSSVHAEEDDFVPELQRSIHPRERPDWEETLSAMARGADIPDIPGELPLRSCGSTASMKVKNVKKLSFTKGHFPKMAECAHFHYENVDFGNIQPAILLPGMVLKCSVILASWICQHARLE
ncbi:hypothetical protein DUI87_31653 [Hirundo rustica rustica]|uniref:Rho GTPase-activating protein 32 n=1 Tax=Hirundo rustica rustica TaxID=333673 RepID=A0A3M0IZD8_HIRRU|nr:hypothetical protein DUI87_31653 [Hirundo rustica rustica]